MIGTHPNVGLKFGRWLDTVMMQRALGEGAATVPAERIVGATPGGAQRNPRQLEHEARWPSFETALRASSG